MIFYLGLANWVILIRFKMCLLRSAMCLPVIESMKKLDS